MKLYFTRREVARIVGVSPETLKTWERYLPLQLRVRGGRKLYTRRDVELVVQAHRLMKQRGLALKDVAAALESYRREGDQDPWEFRTLRETLQDELRVLQRELRRLIHRFQSLLEKEEEKKP